MDKLICSERRCAWRGVESEVLKAPNPFENGVIWGCPTCREVNSIISACAEPDCWKPVSCGTPTPTGYRQTCGEHYPTKAIRKAATELLRIEFLRHHRIEAPWHCVETDCPYLGKPVSKGSCKCYNDFQREHVAAVKKELGL